MDAVVLLHLTCLTVWPTLLDREKHSWLCKDRQVWWNVLQNHTHVSPHSSSSIHNHKEGGKINIYNELLRIVETFAEIPEGNFKMKGRKRREHFTRVHHFCSLSHDVVKALDSRCTVETLRWGLVNAHTHTEHNGVNLADFTSRRLHWRIKKNTTTVKVNQSQKPSS